MKYAIELFLDSKAEKSIHSFFKKMAKTKISSEMLDSKSHPHISLLVFETDNLPSVIQSFNAVTKDMHKLTLYFPSLATFHDTGVLFLAPGVTFELQMIHQKIFKALNPHIKNISLWYLPGVLTYHCTLGINLSKTKLIKAFNLALKTNLPKGFKAGKISLVAIHDQDKPLWAESLYTVSLKSSKT